MPVFELPTTTPAAPSSTVPSGQVDHADAAVKRLPQQFKTKPRIVAMLKCFVSPAQELESVLWQIIERSVDTANDVVLDLIGKVVGQLRLGLDDDSFRRYIRARIVSRRSNGLLETVIKVARLIVNDPALYIRVVNEGTATCTVTLIGDAVTDDVGAIVAEILQATVSAGVRVVTRYSAALPANTFRFDSGPGFDVGHLGRGI